MASELEQSRYIIFADESGDHGLNRTSHSRAFVIAFAIFRRDIYEAIAVPALQHFKRRYLGSEFVPLHEREIRTGDGYFRQIPGPAAREAALNHLRLLLQYLPYSIVAVGIDKDRFTPNPDHPGSPYHRRFLETLVASLRTMPDISTAMPPTEIVADSRGKKEDEQLRMLVNTGTDSDDPALARFQFRIRFTSKSDIEVGVELADLIANPISRQVLNQQHPIVPFRLLEPKFLRHPVDPIRPALFILERE